ncbi:hypothetical protein ACI2KR_30100 [Pseudomonas luteola]
MLRFLKSILSDLVFGLGAIAEGWASIGNALSGRPDPRSYERDYNRYIEAAQIRKRQDSAYFYEPIPEEEQYLDQKTGNDRHKHP